MTRKLTTEEFIQKAKGVHGDKYDYSLVEYIVSSKKVTIICPEHGEFEQRPNDHLTGNGCPSCKTDSLRLSFKTTTEEFIQKAKEVHGDKYDYSKTEYINSYTKVKITCPMHGSFDKFPRSHIRGAGCDECKKSNFYPISNTSERMIKRFKEVHGDKYDYSLVEYNGCHKNVTIICLNHGEFEQTPTNHLQGKGCRSCFCERSSLYEFELCDFLKEYFSIYSGNRTIIKPYELDIVIPSKKLAIEFNGLYWHSELYKDKNYHKMKTDLCEQHGYQLIHIFEDEWAEKPDLVKRMLKHKLGVDDSPKVYARKCDIGLVSFNDHQSFMEQNHIQGSISASIRLGLYYNDELVACLSFKTLSNGNYDLVRYATSKNVVGGFSRLLKYFKSNYDWKSIITFANRRYSQGNLYLTNGFTHVYNTHVNYYYTKQQWRYSRNQFQKHKLKDKLENYDSNLTEHQNCFNHGYYRIYDSGHMKFELHNA